MLIANWVTTAEENLQLERELADKVKAEPVALDSLAALESQYQTLMEEHRAHRKVCCGVGFYLLLCFPRHAFSLRAHSCDECVVVLEPENPLDWGLLGDCRSTAKSKS